MSKTKKTEYIILIHGGDMKYSYTIYSAYSLGEGFLFSNSAYLKVFHVCKNILLIINNGYTKTKNTILVK